MEHWISTYINPENPFAWTNLIVLLGMALWFLPNVRARWHRSRKVVSEADKIEAENQTAERGSLLNSIKKLEDQIADEISARQKLQRELDDLKSQFTEFKRLSMEKEADYLRQIEALKKKNKELQRKLNGGSL